MNLNTIGIIVSMIGYGFAVDKLMEVFFGHRKTKYAVMLLSYLPLLLFSGIYSTLFENIHISMLFITPILLFFVTLNYESSMFKRIVAAFYILILSETAVAIASNFFASHLPPFNNISEITIRHIATSLILYITASVMLRYFKHIKRNTFNFHAFFILVLIIVGTFLAASLYITSTVSRVTYFYLYTFLLAGSTFMVFYLYNSLSKAHEEKLESALHTQEKEYYLTQCQLMQESSEKIKSLRHDMVTHLATLKDYTSKGKVDEVASYLNTLLGKISESEIYSETSNLAFDSIINFKLKNAKADNINLDMSIKIPPALNVDVVDIVTILGNLFDNALDAVAKVEEKIIKLDIEFSKGVLFIKIENSFDGIVKYTYGNAGEEKHMLSVKDGDEHGHGLKNIRRSVEKYNGYVRIDHTDNIFSVGILLHVDDV